jgi:hypothetical protein
MSDTAPGPPRTSQPRKPDRRTEAESGGGRGPDGPALIVSRDEWAGFITRLQATA